MDHMFSGANLQFEGGGTTGAATESCKESRANRGAET